MCRIGPGIFFPAQLTDRTSEGTLVAFVKVNQAGTRLIELIGTRSKKRLN